MALLQLLKKIEANKLLFLCSSESKIIYFGSFLFNSGAGSMRFISKEL